MFKLLRTKKKPMGQRSRAIEQLLKQNIFLKKGSEKERAEQEDNNTQITVFFTSTISCNSEA